MKTIWKFPIKKADKVEIIMPAAAEVLTAQWGYEEPCIWALVNPFEQKNETRTFEVFGTGQDIPVDMGVERKYINTFQMPSQIGLLVFHVFERIN